MKRLRFFGLLVTVVLLAFGLSVGCNNDTTTTGGESDPVVYRGTSNGRAIEITFDTAPIPGRARATEPRPGDNYLITIGGQTASSGWIELQEGGLILFHDTTGKGDFYGQLSGQSVIVDVPGESATLTAGLVGGSGTYNPGGGGPGGNVGSGPGTPGTTAPGATGVPGEFNLTPPATSHVPVTNVVLASDSYIILDDTGKGSLQLAATIFPANATGNKVTKWEAFAPNGTAGTLAATAKTTIDDTSVAAAGGVGAEGPNGFLTVEGANPPAVGQTIILYLTIPDGGATAGTLSNVAGVAQTITVYPHGTVPPPKISLVNAGEDGGYIAGKSSIKIDAESRSEIRYITGASTIASGTPTTITGTVYAGPIPISTEQTGSLYVRAIAVNGDGKASPDIEIPAPFTQAVTPKPLITLNGGDFASGGVNPGFILAQGGAKASTFTITSVAGAEVYYATTDTTNSASGHASWVPTFASVRYTGPVTITEEMLNSSTDFAVQAIAYLTGYAASPVSNTYAEHVSGTPAAITQAKVQDPVIEISAGGVPQGESATGNSAADTFHLSTTNPSMFSISSKTKGVDIYYIAQIDGVPSPTTIAQIDALYSTTASANMRFPWTTPVTIYNGISRFADNTTTALALTNSTLQIKAYANKPGYLPSAVSAAILNLATVQAPEWIRDPNTGMTYSSSSGGPLAVDFAADWDNYKALEIYSATPGARIRWVLSRTGATATVANAATVAAVSPANGNVTYVDLTASDVTTFIGLMAKGDLLTLAVSQAAEKEGYKASSAPTFDLGFTKGY